MAGLAGCGDEGAYNGADDAAATDAASGGTSTPTEESSPTQPPDGPRQRILIKTHVTGFTGKVLTGSVLGGSPFCPGGTVRHERGSYDVGWPAVNVFRCSDGRLELGFGPGADQMNKPVQTSGWEVLGGSGRFAGAGGEGRMVVRWARVGAAAGDETFRGAVVLP